MAINYGIIDYGMGNLKSIYNAFKALGHKNVKIVNAPEELEQVDAIILPGVGAFADGMHNLNHMGFVDKLKDEVVIKKKPYLGICLGLQFMADMSHEYGQCKGFGWIKGNVEKIKVSDKIFKVPHMGWNDVEMKNHGILFNNLGDNPVFYFVHSFYLNPLDKILVTSICFHGMEIIASIEKENIFGVQFHPEKSLGAGLQVLNNFCDYVEKNQDA